MYAYLKGTIEQCSPTQIILEVRDIGYELRVSLTTYTQFKGQASAKLYTYLRVQEDAHTLYGFHSEDEKDLFIDLISVSGVGASTALVMLSSASDVDIKSWIAGSNTAALTKLKGIGGKTAQHICLALSEKMQKRGVAPASPVPGVDPLVDNTIKDDAISALVSLGLTKSAATTAVTSTLAAMPGASLEDVIKKSLNR